MVGIIKTVIVDPNPIFREGLVRILSDVGGMDCAGFASFEEIEETKVANWKRVLFLLDFGQDCTFVAHGIGHLRERFPKAVVVILSERYSHDHMIGSLRAGASGYLLKQVSCEILIKSLELVSLGEHVFPEQAVQLLCREDSLEGLSRQANTRSSDIFSPREVEVLRGLGEGKSNKVIARQWGISEATVKVHVKAIFRKLQVKNRTEAALWARDQGLCVKGNGNLALLSEVSGSGAQPRPSANFGAARPSSP